MGKKTARLSPYVFPGLKLTQKEREGLKNSQRSLRFRMSKDEILDIIAEECCIKVSDIADKTRKREVVNGRFIFCGIMKEYFGYSLKKIGEFVRWRGPGHFRTCSANSYHRIELDPAVTCWTLFMPGPQTREWGFLVKDKWIHNETYLTERAKNG